MILRVNLYITCKIWLKTRKPSNSVNSDRVDEFDKSKKINQLIRLPSPSITHSPVPFSPFPFAFSQNSSSHISTLAIPQLSLFLSPKTPFSFLYFIYLCSSLSLYSPSFVLLRLASLYQSLYQVSFFSWWHTCNLILEDLFLEMGLL